MNAPANLPQPERLGPKSQAIADADMTDIDRAYATTIFALMGAPANEMETAFRVSIAKKRDAAMVGVRRASNGAAVILNEVVRMATSAVYSRMPISHLIRINSTLDFVMEAARAVERTEQAEDASYARAQRDG